MKKIVALILALVMVMGLATVASAATAAQSSDAGVAAAVTTTTAKMQDLAPQVDASKTFATYGLLVTDNTTKTVTSYGPFNKVPSATNATWTYVDGTTIVYLTDKVTGATWNQKAEAVKVGYNVAAYAECGEFYVDDPAEVGTYYLFDKVFYEECDYMTAATITFNVDGMVVWAKVTDKVHYQDHSYKVDTVKTNATVGIAASKVYCSACEKVFDFVDGTEAMAIAKFGVGNYDEAVAGYAFTGSKIYVGTAAVSAGTAGSAVVESAQTFDAGIAMYVGMSVMAAAGSAVVLKKKD